MRPPRLMAARKLAKMPAVKARILNRLSVNMGSRTRTSMMQKATRRIDAQGQGDDDPWTGPAHGVAAVGLDPVGDADHDGDEAEGEGRVAPPVDVGRAALAQLAQLEVAPDGGEEPDGHRDQEDEAPVDRGQDAAEDQPDERAAEGGRLVHPHGHAALGLGEGVGEDGGRVGHEHGRPHALEDAHDDQVHGGGVAGQPGHAEARARRR